LDDYDEGDDFFDAMDNDENIELFQKEFVRNDDFEEN